MSDDKSSNSSLAQPIDQQAERRARREERRLTRTRDAGLAGVALIILGALFLLQNTGLLYFNNGWALFILLPATGSMATAYGAYRRHGRWTAAGRGALISGLLLMAVMAFFLFDMDWSKWWPLLLIFFGIGALVNELVPSSPS